MTAGMQTSHPLALQEQAYGRSHPSVATTLHNLGGMYTQQGDYPAAMAAYADALRCKEASLGRLHPEYAATLAHLAEVTALHGRPGDAAALLQESLEVMEAIGAGYSRLAQRRMTRLAHLLSASRQHPQAAAVHRKLVQAADMAPSGPEDGGAAMWAVHARVGLADALAAIPSSVPEAQQLYSQCLADTRRLCGEAHPLTAACMRRVADMHAREGSPTGLAQAEELLRTALQVLAAQLEAKADVIPDVNRERLVITQEVTAAHLCLAEVLQTRKAPGSEVAGHVAAASAALDAAPPGYARDALSVRLRAFAR
jgi:tetratricopeptide (TPR) repeat protein